MSPTVQKKFKNGDTFASDIKLNLELRPFLSPTMKKLIYLIPLLLTLSCRKEKLEEYCSTDNFNIHEKLKGGSMLQPGVFTVRGHDKTKIIEKN